MRVREGLLRELGDTTLTPTRRRRLLDALGKVDIAVLGALKDRSEKLGLPMAKVAMAWLRTKPAVCAPIIGATKISHVEDAVASLEIVLGEEDIAALEAPYRPKPVLLHR